MNLCSVCICRNTVQVRKIWPFPFNKWLNLAIQGEWSRTSNLMRCMYVCMWAVFYPQRPTLWLVLATSVYKSSRFGTFATHMHTLREDSCGASQHVRTQPHTCRVNNILWEGWVVFCLWSMPGKSVVRAVDLTVKNLSKQRFLTEYPYVVLLCILNYTLTN